MRDDSKTVMFLLGNWGIGGVERATVVLANSFVEEGWDVTIVAFKYNDKTLLSLLSSNVRIEELRFPVFRIANIFRLRKLFRDSNIRYVVNQWALPVIVSVVLLLARGIRRHPKIISMQHNLPDKNKHISDARNALTRCFWTVMSRISLRMVYGMSSAHLVTSASFIPIFAKFIGRKNVNKSQAIPYPLTLSPQRASQKEDIIIYVGRLEQTQKRVDRIIDMWRAIHDKLPTWRLDIVGDGPDLSMLKDRAKGLERITFHGFQDPTQYYAKGKIIVLTSDFEGFGLVLVEAMCAGCVPVIYGSYPAAYEIADGSNGKVLPMPYDEDAFAEAVLSYATNPESLAAASAKAENKSNEYNPKSIVRRYIKLFEGLN